MSRFYRSLRVILRYAVGIYFFDIQATGQEHVPDEGPLIFASNHPNSIMDTVLLGTQTDRQIQYMARSGLFKNPLVKLLFGQVGVIPIFRAQDSDDLKKNVASFQRAYETLEDGGCIGIFPEGKNSQDRKIGKLKTGTARIALATEDRNDFSLGVTIVPVGLNFEERTRFLSRVLIRFGKPIDVRAYGQAYGADRRKVVMELTDRIAADMRILATHIEDDRNRELVIDVHAIYGNELAREVFGDIETDLDLRPLTHKLIDRARSTDRTRDDLGDRFELEQRIAHAVDYFQRTDPGLVARVRMDIHRYRDHLRQVRLHHELLEEGIELKGQRWKAIKMTAYALALGPIAIYGFVNNFIPYLMVRTAVRRQPDEARVAFAGFATGLLTFPLFYFLQGWALWNLADKTLPVVIIYLLSLPITGFFFLRWWRQMLAYRDQILSRTLFRTRGNLIENLEKERRNLIGTFEKLKQRYLEAHRRQPNDAAAALDMESPPALVTQTDEAGGESTASKEVI